MEKPVSLSSSLTDSTMSLNIITVSLNKEKSNFLGVSIVSSETGDGGLFIGSILRGGAAEADGRITPGDMLLQVNEVDFENLTNDEAVGCLRDIVHSAREFTLTVAKCWDPNPPSCFTLPTGEPVHPIDPAAWVSHTAAMTGKLLPHYGVPERHQLTIHSDITDVVMAMTNPESGLEVRDRMWLKIPIPKAFMGSDAVDWLHRNVAGLSERRQARKFAGNLLRSGFIRHTARARRNVGSPGSESRLDLGPAPAAAGPVPLQPPPAAALRGRGQHSPGSGSCGLKEGGR